MRLLKRVPISVGHYQKASSTATSSSVHGTAPAFPFVTATWLMAQPYILSLVWRLASEMGKLKCGNPIAGLQRDTRLSLKRSLRREPEELADNCNQLGNVLSANEKEHRATAVVLVT